MFCTQCGNKLAENSKFCPLCGTAAQPMTQPAAQQPVAAQPVYGAPVYSYPVYVMPAPTAQAAPQPAAPVAAPAAAPANPYTAPVSASESIPAYRRPRPTAEVSATPAAGTAADVPAASAANTTSATPPAEDDIEFVLEPTYEDMETPLTVWQTIVCLLALFCLPLGNIIFACVWGFRLNEHPQRRTLARAALPFIAIGLIALFSALLWIVLNMHTVSISFH